MNGTFCDLVVVPEHFVFPVPQGLSLEAAALAEPAAVAVQAVNRGRVHPGDVGVIVGAGPIGLLTLQAFKAAGGSYAVCVDKVPERLEWAKQLGSGMKFSSPRNRSLRLKIKGILYLKPPGNNASTAPALYHGPPWRQMRAGGVARQQHRSCGCGKADGKGTGLHGGEPVCQCL